MLASAGVRQSELVCSGAPEHQTPKYFTTETEQKEVHGPAVIYMLSVSVVYDQYVFPFLLLIPPLTPLTNFYVRKKNNHLCQCCCQLLTLCPCMA